MRNCAVSGEEALRGQRGVRNEHRGTQEPQNQSPSNQCYLTRKVKKGKRRKFLFSSFVSLTAALISTYSEDSLLSIRSELDTAISRNHSIPAYLK